MVDDPIAMKQVGVVHQRDVMMAYRRAIFAARDEETEGAKVPRDIRSQRYRSLAVTGNICKPFSGFRTPKEISVPCPPVAHNFR